MVVPTTGEREPGNARPARVTIRRPIDGPRHEASHAAPAPWRASGTMLLDARGQHVATFRERDTPEELAASLTLAAGAHPLLRAASGALLLLREPPYEQGDVNLVMQELADAIASATGADAR